MTDTATGDAPGRVNLIGEHTDYHQGYVLPTVIPQHTTVAVQRRRDQVVRAVSDAMGDGVLKYEAGGEVRGGGWLDYVQGATWELARRGLPIPGLEISIHSTIPTGAGVSSSAALLVGLLRALRTLLSLELDDVTLARIAQTVETEFVGAPVGIMDQMAVSLGRSGEALFLDTRTLAVEHVPIPPSIELIVIDSGIRHQHAGGEYATRRRESFEAAALLSVDFLREVRDARGRISGLPSVLARRARHIITENERVLDAVAALRDGDAARLGALFSASHRSMRDDYETSTEEVNLLVTIAERHADIYGARLTGGGFGGAIVALARAGRGRTAAAEICGAYRLQTQRGAVVVPPEPLTS